MNLTLKIFFFHVYSLTRIVCQSSWIVFMDIVSDWFAIMLTKVKDANEFTVGSKRFQTYLKNLCFIMLYIVCLWNQLYFISIGKTNPHVQ